MLITKPHYVGLTLLLSQEFSELDTKDVLPRLLRAQGLAQYEDLAEITEADLTEVLPGIVPSARRQMLSLLHALNPHVGVCPHDGLLAIHRKGSTWNMVDACPVCGTLLPKSGPLPTQFNWVTGVEDRDNPKYHMQPGGLRVCLLMEDLAREVGGLDPQLAEVAAAEGTTVPKLLHALLKGPAKGDIRELLGVLSALPKSWTIQNGLQVLLRRPVAATPTHSFNPSPVTQTGLSLNFLVQAAIASELVDPNRRSLLLYGIDIRHAANLTTHGNPADQIRSDIYRLYDWGLLHLWCHNAAGLVFNGALFTVYERYLLSGGVLPRV